MVSASQSQGQRLSWAGAVPRSMVKFVQTLQKPKHNPALSGTLAPVFTETFSKELQVKGSVPSELQGLYIRTGSNPTRMPTGNYHWFDGDAMVHAVYFADGKALSYNNHWLRTPKYEAETTTGVDSQIRLGDMRGVLGLVQMQLRSAFAWAFPMGRPGVGDYQLGNTALVWHRKKLLAVMEGGLPFLVKACEGLVRSVGAFSFGGQLRHAFTAHPKVDPDTGDMHFFKYGFGGPKEEWCVYRVVRADGTLTAGHSVDVQHPQMMHDFAISERYALFLDGNLWFDGAAMVKQGTLPFVPAPSAKSRIGVVSKAEPEKGAQWFDIPSCFAFHMANAWEEGDDTVCLAMCSAAEHGISHTATKLFNISRGPFLTRFTLTLSTGTVRAEPLLGDVPCEFPTMPPQLVGKRQRFAYCARYRDGHIDDGATESLVAILKADLLAEEGRGLVAQIDLPRNHQIGEPLFVARDPAALQAGAAGEDDGWLVSFVTDADTLESFCNIYDAKTMAPEPVASVAMPQRVPAGFHGTFVTKAQLATQDARLDA